MSIRASLLAISVFIGGFASEAAGQIADSTSLARKAELAKAAIEVVRREVAPGASSNIVIGHYSRRAVENAAAAAAEASLRNTLAASYRTSSVRIDEVISCERDPKTQKESPLHCRLPEEHLYVGVRSPQIRGHEAHIQVDTWVNEPGNYMVYRSFAVTARQSDKGWTIVSKELTEIS